MSDNKVRIELNVNNEIYAISIEARKSLADALREDCALTGTHLGCEHGVCGACTVLIDDQPARACLVLAIQAEGSKIRTVEGLASDNGDLHPVQDAFWKHHGLQCGFCTPGFLMLATALYEQDKLLDDDELIAVLASNLCRCTGYQNIITAVKSVIENKQS